MSIHKYKRTRLTLLDCQEIWRLYTSTTASCKEFTNLLMALGFRIENCGSTGHKIARHPTVSLIEYPNYNCSHHKGEAVKRPYIKKLYKFVKQHENAIKEHIK